MTHRSRRALSQRSAISADVSKRYVAALHDARSPLVASRTDEQARHRAVTGLVQELLDTLDENTATPPPTHDADHQGEHADTRLAATKDATKILFALLADVLIDELDHDPRAVATALLDRFLQDAGTGAELINGYAAAHGLVAPGIDYSRLNTPLTPREKEVFELLLLRRSAKEISERLGIHVETVKTHTSHITRKLGARGVRAATAKALELGVLTAATLTALPPIIEALSALDMI